MVKVETFWSPGANKHISNQYILKVSQRCENEGPTRVTEGPMSFFSKYCFQTISFEIHVGVYGFENNYNVFEIRITSSGL